jgi:DtxR family Mn-dependent transcriptional regulator
MAEAVGEPAVDPLGAPCPTRDGAVEERRRASLGGLEAGTRGTVSRVRDEDGSLLRYLAELGIRPGAVVSVVDRAPFDGPIRLEVDGVERTVGRPVATAVLVEEE